MLALICHSQSLYAEVTNKLRLCKKRLGGAGPTWQLFQTETASMFEDIKYLVTSFQIHRKILTQKLDFGAPKTAT